MLIVDPGSNARLIQRKPWLLRPGSGGGGPPPVDYEAEVEALLSGTAGWAFDPADPAIVFEDTGGTDPVEGVGTDTIARINSKFGTTVYNWQNGTVAQQYLWNGASMQGDGVDDLLSTAAWTCMSGITGVTFTIRFLVDSFVGATVQRMLFSCSTPTGTVGRFQLRASADGSILLALRRLDADATQSFSSSAGLISEGVAYTLQVTVNYLNGAVEFFLDGVSVFTGTYTGTDGVTGVSATNSTRCRWGLNTSNTLNDYLDGKIGCAVMQLAVATAGERASAKGFVERNAL